MTPEWDPELVTRLRSHVAEGMSAGKISDILGISRSAVAGKAFRLGIKLLGHDRKPRNVLPPRPSRPAGASSADRKTTHAIKRAAATADPAKPAPDGDHYVAWRIAQRAKEPVLAPALPATEVVDLPVEIIPADQRKTLHELTADSCRWPIGHPNEADFHFCGGQARANHPYCAAHCRMAYETPTQRKARLVEWRAEQKKRAA